MGLTITSIMDMMTIILVFLLKSFSAEGQLLTNADNLVLPNSTSKESPKETSLMVAVTNDWVLVDNIPVIRTQDVRKKEDISITPVKEKLEVAMAQEENMVRVGALSRVKGEVVLQFDKNVEYDVLYKVMATCGEVGYNAIKFAVMGREE
jgi:biopolymer transport protein ExbD